MIRDLSCTTLSIYNFYFIFQIDCKKQILLSLHQLARSCPVSKLEEFCLGTLAVLFTESGVDNDVLCESGMMGLSEALQISDPVQHVMPVLYHTVQTIYPDVDVEKYQVSFNLCCNFVNGYFRIINNEFNCYIFKLYVYSTCVYILLLHSSKASGPTHFTFIL